MFIVLFDFSGVLVVFLGLRYLIDVIIA